MKPEEREEIEVVRRLVEQEEIRLHDEQAREVGAHDPAAAELLAGAVEILLAVAEALEHFPRLRLDVRAAERLVLRVGLEVFRSLDDALFLERGQERLERRNLACASGGDVERSLVADRLALLRQVAEHRPLVALDRARIRVVPF